MFSSTWRTKSRARRLTARWTVHSRIWMWRPSSVFNAVCVYYASPSVGPPLDLRKLPLVYNWKWIRNLLGHDCICNVLTEYEGFRRKCTFSSSCILKVWRRSCYLFMKRQFDNNCTIKNVLIVWPLTTSLTVTLYNCSMGREDCSLCKNADPMYRCVWCAKQRACVYEKLCNAAQQGVEDPHNTECPDPQITDVSSYGVVISSCWPLDCRQYVHERLVTSREAAAILEIALLIGPLNWPLHCPSMEELLLLEGRVELVGSTSWLDQFFLRSLNCWCLIVIDKNRWCQCDRGYDHKYNSLTDT